MPIVSEIFSPMKSGGATFRAFCDSAPLGIFLTDLEGRFTYANSRCQVLCGFVLEERVGEEWSCFLAGDDRFRIRRAWSAAGRAKDFEAEIRIRNQEGVARWVSVRTSPWVGDRGVLLGYIGTVEDVGVRKEAEEELKASKAEFRMFSEMSPDIVYSLAVPEGTFTSINPRFEKITGWRCSEWIGRPFSELLHEDDVPLAMARLREALAGDAPSELDVRFRTKSGGYRYAEVVAKPQMSEGKLVGLFGLARDMTRRKIAEDHFNIEYIVSRILADSTTVGEASHKILRAVCDALRWDRGELWTMDPQVNALRCGETWQNSTLALFHLDALARQASRLGQEPLVARIYSTGKPAAVADITKVARYRRGFAAGKAGLRGAFGFAIRTDEEVLAVMIFFSREVRKPDKELLQTFTAMGSQVGLFIKRMRAEEGLRASERRFYAFMNNSAAMAWIKDHDFRYVFVNRAFEQQLAISMASVIGKTDFEIWPAKIAEELRSNDRAVFQSGALSQSYEKLPARAGNLRYCRVFRFQFRDAERRFLGGIAMDITERKEVEEALRRLPKHIVHAEERERRRVARELHDSVCQLISSARFRLQSVVREADLETKVARDNVAKTIDLLVRALREVRHISHNLLPSELEDLGLLPAIRSACADLEERTGIRIKLRVVKLPPRLGHEVELTLYRILQEALSNVEKHSRASGVHLTLTQENSIIQMRIQDDGDGFAPNPARRRNGEKSGLGLVNKRQRAALVGGTFEVKSAPKKGTEITARIPVYEDSAQ